MSYRKADLTTSDIPVFKSILVFIKFNSNHLSTSFYIVFIIISVPVSVVFFPYHFSLVSIQYLHSTSPFGGGVLSEATVCLVWKY